MTEEIDINILHELIRDIAGKNAEPIADILRDKDEVNEYKIADRLKVTVNQVRNILYKLFDRSIVSFTRKKDKQKGWYIYFWSLNVSKALQQYIKIKEKEIEDMRHNLSGCETRHYYSCPSGCVELNEETALHYNFICQECGRLLALSIKTGKIDELKKAIEKAQRRIEIARKELVMIEEEAVKKLEHIKKKKSKKRAGRKAKSKAKARKKPKKAGSRKKKAKKKVKKTRKSKKAKKKR